MDNRRHGPPQRRTAQRSVPIQQARERTVGHRPYSAPSSPRRHPVGRVPRPGVPRIFPTTRRVRTPGEGTGPTLPTHLARQPREWTVRHRPYQTGRPSPPRLAGEGTPGKTSSLQRTVQPTTSPCRPGPPTRRPPHFPYGPTCTNAR